jgi:hypothetical protein
VTLETITNGMRVVDHEGNRVGFVADMKMGDPYATTADGQNRRNDQSVGMAGLSVVPPGVALPDDVGLSASGADEFLDVPHEHAVRLLRLGYIKVKRHHLRSNHFFVASDGIDRVDDDTVYLHDLDAPVSSHGRSTAPRREGPIDNDEG